MSTSELYMPMSLDGCIAGLNDEPGNPGGNVLTRKIPNALKPTCVISQLIEFLQAYAPALPYDRVIWL